MRADDAPLGIRLGYLEDGLCKINGNGCSIHVGLLSFEDLIPTPMKTSAQLLREKREESIPSFDAEPELASLSLTLRLNDDNEQGSDGSSATTPSARYHCTLSRPC